MKMLDVARPNWGTLTLAVLAGTAAGFAAGYLVGRDPAAARRVAGRAAHWAALGTEQATLWAAQLREQLGDLWAEAREASTAAVDEADFGRQAAAAPPSSSGQETEPVRPRQARAAKTSRTTSATGKKAPAKAKPKARGVGPTTARSRAKQAA